MSEIIPLYGSQNSTYSQAVWNDTIGKRSFELSNHLGNVLTVISDKVIQYDDANNGDIDWFLADIRQSTDYSAFGVQLENRNLLLTGVGEDYSLGFQGQFEDDEFKGEGNSVNYSFRMHDPRLGRFFAIDPLTSEFPWNSPYAFSENIVINAVELEGLETAYVYNVTYSGKEKKVKKSHNYENNNNFNQRVYRYFNANGEVAKELVQKLDSKGKVISNQIQTYASDGNPTTHTTPLLSKSTIGEKESISEKLPAFMKDGNMEGGDDAANTGGDYNGTSGMYNAADDLDWIGDKLSYFPTPITLKMGTILQGEADVLRSIADYNTLDYKTATKNLGIRAITFGLDKKIGKDIEKAGFSKEKKYVTEQAVRKTIDGIKEAGTTKP
jgi:RHS repeat-associated protein